MELAARMERADTYLDYNPRFFLQKSTAVLRVFEIMVGVIFFHLPAGVMTRASGVEGGALRDVRWSTCRRRATLGHKSGSPDALFTITHPHDAVYLGFECQNGKFCGL